MSSHSNWHRKWLNSNWTVKLFYKDNRFFCEKAPVWTSGLHHGLKQKQKADYGISSKSKTKRLIFLGKFRTISHYMCCTLSMLQMVFPHIPFIYIVVLFGSDQSVYFQLHLHLRWWLCGLKGSVDITFKAWSSVLPLSQEMRVSHGLCLLQEKQQATWESAGSHDLYQRFLWTNQAESLTYGGDGHMLRCFAKPRPALVPVHSNPKLSFKVDRAVWNVKVLSRCLIINPNCRVNEKHGLIFFIFFFGPLRASACLKCHRYNSNWPSGCLYKWPCIPECEIGTKQRKSFTRIISEKAPQVLGFHMLLCFFEAANMSLEQSMHYARPSWREHRAIRHPSGRHPVFTGKPLKPGLMHSKHTSLHKCGWWLSGPVSILSSCSRASSVAFKMGRAAAIRLVLLDWAAPNQELTWSPLKFIAAPQSHRFCPFRVLSLPPPLRAGWAQFRRPQTRQTSPFSCIVSIWRSHCAKF